MGYNDKYLTPKEEKIVYLLEKFEVIDSRTVIEIWKEVDDSHDEYLSKL